VPRSPPQDRPEREGQQRRALISRANGRACAGSPQTVKQTTLRCCRQDHRLERWFPIRPEANRCRPGFLRRKHHGRDVRRQKNSMSSASAIVRPPPERSARSRSVRDTGSRPGRERHPRRALSPA
jgi:hypothetical protein